MHLPVALETTLQDVVWAWRTLRKSPGFAITALAALAIGIGANTAIFSVVNAVLLRPLTYPQADRIVLFYLTTPTGPAYGGSATKFNAWGAQTQVFEDVAAYEYTGAQLNLTGGANPEQVHGIRVSAGYFRLFGAAPVVGRTFGAEEDLPGGANVAVLSYGLWQRRFGGDPGLIGKSILLGGAPYTVVGVLSGGFNSELNSPPDVWTPLKIDPESRDHAQFFNVVGRLRPGISLAMANAQLQIAAGEFRRRFPNIMGERDGFGVELFQDSLVSGVKPSLVVLAGAVGLVLLIACANVAGLLLVRATGRRREIAVRAAIGAGHGRIVRQLLIESLLLSGAGGAAGLVLGVAGVRALLAGNAAGIPRIGDQGTIALDWRLPAFTIGLAVVTGMLFGLAPAVNAARADLTAVLREGARSGTSRRQSRTRSLLVVAEIALALVLLVGAALLIRTFVALRAVDPGFDSHQVLTLRLSLAGSRFASTSDVSRLAHDAMPRLETLPGVVRAAVSYSLPLEGNFGVPFQIVGRTPVGGRYDGRGWMGVSPGYFEVFRIPLAGGRAFTDRDDGGASRVAIINQAMARQFWPKGNPLGERILLGQGYGPEFAEPAREIVGIVGDVHDQGLNLKPNPVVYVPAAQVTDGITALAMRASTLAWAVRTRVPPETLRGPVEEELRRATGGLPVGRVVTMDEIVRESTGRADFNMSLLTIFGCAALLLAGIGIYGVMAYSVRQRTQEIGIRIALGAEGRHVRDMIVAQGMRLALGGVAIGVVAAFGLTRLLANFLFGVDARDPFVFITVPLVLGGVALAAVWVPAMRATRVDPVTALRSQ